MKAPSHPAPARALADRPSLTLTLFVAALAVAAIPLGMLLG